MGTSAELAAAKPAYTTRHVRLETIDQVITGGRPSAGDLVLARVAEIGQHPKLELSDGRRATLYEGEPIIVASATGTPPISSRRSCPRTWIHATSSPPAGSLGTC